MKEKFMLVVMYLEVTFPQDTNPGLFVLEGIWWEGLSFPILWEQEMKTS